ncbi:MAG: GGDEF domain-containing protein [Clostridiales bacterium]|nr:GGDEF domain-containing protein [Clostridiales bacterium]
MKKLKPNIALFIPLFLLLIGGLFIKAGFFTYEKCVESEKEKIEEYLTYTSETATLRITAIYEKMLLETQLMAGLIPQGNADPAEFEDVFNLRNLSSEAQAGFLLSADGVFEYSEGEYEENFGYLAKMAEQTGETQVSKVMLFNDGQRRFAVAAPVNTGGAAVLVFPASVITQDVESELFEGAGRILLIDSEGNPLSPSMLEDEYADAITGVDVSRGRLSEHTDRAGEKFHISASPAGEIGWTLVCYVSDSYIRDNAVDVFSAVFSAYTLSFALITCFGIISAIIISLRRKKLYVARKHFDIATKQSARATYQFDRKNNIISIISGNEKIKFPNGMEDISPDMFMRLIHPIDRRKFRCGIDEFEKNGTASVSVRITRLGGSDNYRWYNIDATRLTQMRHSAELVIGSVEDIDERERERLMLRKKATTDPLTGLYDRAEAQRIINEKLLGLGESEHSIFGIIDLDNFKLINDLFGHECGDRALLLFSEKLKATFRFGDIIGRLGGDEFMVYIAHTADRKVVERRFLELMESLSKVKLRPEFPEISCSVGYVTASRGDSFESLYKRADEAMYKAKTTGKKRAVGE